MNGENQFTIEKLLQFREFGAVTRNNFKNEFNKLRVSNFSLSKIRDVKVVGHGAITSVAIDPLGKKSVNFDLTNEFKKLFGNFSEWRYILAGSSDGLIAIYDSNGQTNAKSPKKVAEIVGITSKLTPNKYSTSVIQWHPYDNGLFVSSGEI